MKPKSQFAKRSFTASTWESLRRHTPARIAVGRAGGSLPTHALLDFRLSHARAVDAVHREFDAELLCRKVESLMLHGLRTVQLTTAAPDHATFLQRPDLGRKLSVESGRTLARLASQESSYDVVLIVSDGLSALAVERQAPALLRGLWPLLTKRFSVAPLVVVSRGRVAVQDEIGDRLGARLALMLIGERPGLNSPDSLGAYLVYNPKRGNTDADRNCVSNIRPKGFPPAQAAERIHYLLSEAHRRRLSGVGLKDESDSLPPRRQTGNLE